MSDTPDLQEPDQLRPTKRARFEGSLEITAETQEEMGEDDDWDDVYGNNDTQGTVASSASSVPQTTLNDVAPGKVSQTTTTEDVAMPDATPTPTSAQQDGRLAQEVEMSQKEQGQQKDNVQVNASEPTEEEPLVAPLPPVQSTDGPSAKAIEQDTEVEISNVDGLAVSANAKSIDANTIDTQTSKTESSEVLEKASTSEGQADTSSRSRSLLDAEFIEAAAAQKGNKNAEWQFDSSDGESSSDSDTSSDDSSDDSGSEEGYELLDPATVARMLMSGDADEDDGDRSKGKGEYQPRTTNEKQDEVIPKPDVQVTPDMKITLLGHVERIVDNLLLIKGATPGEYQVLEPGSVLCTEERQVIGAVAETLGRVQEPLYSVMFTSAKDIEDTGLDFGTKLFYVESHSTFVFTQPLKNIKGTDASNIHDEEVGEDELEFSDDEVEAEYKRQKKLAKKSGRGGLSRGEFNEGIRIPHPTSSESGPSYSRGNDAPTQNYGGGMSYDDEPAEEFYMPLKRPDNLSQLMAGGEPSRPQQFSGQGRGRGNPRGRGRGDRGRGRGGFENRSHRGVRGGGGPQNSNPHRGNAQSFPDRHNTSVESHRSERHVLPPKPADAQQAGFPVQQYPGQYQQQAPQTYQFNGYTFQYGANPAQAVPPPPQQTYPVPPTHAGMNVPPTGAYGNSAYAPPQYQQPAQQQQQQYPAWAAQQQQQQYPQYQYPPQPQQAQNGQQPIVAPDLGEILKNLGAHRQ